MHRELSDLVDTQDVSEIPEPEPEQVDYDVLRHFVTMFADNLIDVDDKEIDE